MSRMSQIQMELSEQASELGFESIEQAEANGYEVKFEDGNAFLVPDINKAHEELVEEIKRNDEAKQVEMVYSAIQNAHDMIRLIYKPTNEPSARPEDDIKDEKIRRYYYTLNDMLIELADRNVMLWQKEE